MSFYSLIAILWHWQGKEPYPVQHWALLRTSYTQETRSWPLRQIRLTRHQVTEPSAGWNPIQVSSGSPLILTVPIRSTTTITFTNTGPYYRLIRSKIKVFYEKGRRGLVVTKTICYSSNITQLQQHMTDLPRSPCAQFWIYRLCSVCFLWAGFGKLCLIIKSIYFYFKWQ
jgi:hypothetical protein